MSQQQRQQVQQLAVLAEVVVYFRPEVHGQFGEEKVFKQVGLTQEGPFLKIAPGPGASIDGPEMYLFELIAGVKTIPSQITAAVELPREQ